MSRHGFLLHEDGAQLREVCVDAGRVEPIGHVRAARYLEARRPGFFGRLFGARPTLAASMPFDGEARDVLGLFDAPLPAFERRAEPSEPVSAVGTARCLAPRSAGDHVVVRDFWLVGAPFLRLVDAVHFGLDVDEGPDVAVAFAQSPLVVARPTKRSLGEHLARLPEDLVAGVRRVVGHRFDTRAGFAVTLREGDIVEARGVPSAEEDALRRFDLRGREATYREARVPVSLVLGDAPGARMVLRHRSAAAG